MLDRRVLTAREAARQLRIPETTFIRWIEGWTGRGRHYPPVLRDEPTGITDVTWGEMVEARYLRAYRQNDISLQKLRPVIAALRDEYGTPYPLAHCKPYIGDGPRRLLLELQQQHHLPDELRMVYEASTGQIILDRRIEEFLERVDFANEGNQEAERLYPHGKGSPVVMDPRIKSGTATIRGIRTEILAELAEAGMTVDEIAVDYDLPAEDIKAALAYEWTPLAA